MQSNSRTHLNRAFDHLDNVIYIMGEVTKGRNAEEIRKHLVEDDPFNSSREYRGYIANWLIGDYVKGFTPAALEVFARIMTEDVGDHRGYDDNREPEDHAVLRRQGNDARRKLSQIYHRTPRADGKPRERIYGHDLQNNPNTHLRSGRRVYEIQTRGLRKREIPGGV